jgi:hypothetical protein
MEINLARLCGAVHSDCALEPNPADNSLSKGGRNVGHEGQQIIQAGRLASGVVSLVYKKHRQGFIQPFTLSGEQFTDMPCPARNVVVEDRARAITELRRNRGFASD